MKATKPAFILLIVLWALGATALAYVRPPASMPRVSGLSGQFLVAGPRMPDPNFSRCVIYVVAHTGEGAMGLVVNRLFGSIALRDLFADPEIRRAGKTKIDLHYGGPVEMNRGFVLHSDDYTGASTQLFQRGLALSTGPDVVRAVAEGHGPSRTKFLAGYTGWGAGQLEREIARGDWLVAPADPELIFSPDPGTVWERAMRHAGIAL